MIKITSIRASDGGAAARIDLKQDGEKHCFFILREDAIRLSLEAGEYEDSLFSELERLDGVCKAVKSGRRILGYGANSSSALRAKLIRKGISRESAESAIDILASESGLDEERDAMRLCELQLQKNLGARRIIAYLRGRGYGENALSVVTEHLRSVDFTPICRRSLEKKFGGVPEDALEKKKCIDYLIRQGFSYTEVRRAFENS